MSSSSAKRFVLRFVVAYVVLTALCVLLEKPLVRGAAPLLRAGLSVFTPSLEVQGFSVHHGDGDVSALVKITRLQPDGLLRWFRVSANVNARPLFVGPILTLCVLAAWAFRTGKQRAWAFALGTVLSVLCSLQALAVDLDKQILQNFSSTLTAMEQVTVFWAYVIDNGGRQVLGIFAACAGLALAGAFSVKAPVVMTRTTTKAKPAKPAKRAKSAKTRSRAVPS